MRPRAEVDPELHLLRSAARLVQDGRARGEIETARFGMYAAFERQDSDDAARWLRACRVALLLVDLGVVREDVVRALDTIDAAIGSVPPHPER